MASRKSVSDKGTSARCYVGGINVIVGGVSFPVNLFPPRMSTNDMKLDSCCPQCYADTPDEEAVKTEVYHHCGRHIDGHGPFKYSDVVRATKNDDGALQVIGTVEEVRAVKGVNDDPDADDDADDKSFLLAAHLAEDIERNTYPVGTPYVLRPVPGTPTALIPFFLEKIGHDGRFVIGTGKTAKQYVLVGNVTLKGNRKFMAMRTWNGQLVAQELARPADLHSFQPLEVKRDDRFAALIDASLDMVIEDFDPENYENESRKRLAAFAEARLADSDAVVIPMPTRAEIPVAQDNDALLLALEASVAAAKTAKSGKKSA